MRGGALEPGASSMERDSYNACEVFIARAISGYPSLQIAQSKHLRSTAVQCGQLPAKPVLDFHGGNARSGKDWRSIATRRPPPLASPRGARSG